MIIKSKYQNIKNLLLRIIFLILLAMDILFLYPQNQIASIVFGSIILILILILPETRITIKTDYIEFKALRLLGLYNNKIRLDFKNISSANFYPEETNWLIVLLPGVGGHRNAELTFNLKNGEKFSKQIIETNDVINSLTSELGKRIQLEINK
ncbi:hypothetical protein [Carboxylicivirga caseinilyticus]|uniref:hypothetical protein n=1 Tax=Carboxylicivirga caseinilyticus TaxID=3417572 RepID=UPI003D346D99|nr:hypothetical protein [Marinilabiliaceae bacterium A049]